MEILFQFGQTLWFFGGSDQGRQGFSWFFPTFLRSVKFWLNHTTFFSGFVNLLITDPETPGGRWEIPPVPLCTGLHPRWSGALSEGASSSAGTRGPMGWKGGGDSREKLAGTVFFCVFFGGWGRKVCFLRNKKIYSSMATCGIRTMDNHGPCLIWTHSL